MTDRREPHDDLHEEWLASVLGGESNDSEREIAERLERCAQCAAEYVSLRELSLRLRQDADLERAVIERAKQEPISKGDRAALERVRSEKFAELDRPKPRRVDWKSFALAAALLLAATLIIRSYWPTDRSGITDRELGGKLAMSPVGICDSFNVFSFRYDRPRGGWFIIVIQPEDGSEPISSERLLEPRWEIPAEVRPRLSPRIRWRAMVFDGDGQEVVTQDATAELRPR